MKPLFSRNISNTGRLVRGLGALAVLLGASTPPRPLTRTAMPEEGAAESGFLTEAELQRRERDNLIAVLEKANWRVKGRDGAAELLGVNPTTSLARLKKMGDPETGCILIGAHSRTALELWPRTPST